MHLAKEPSLAISNQHWRTFLAAKLDAQPDKQTKSANHL
jgi:hypothetical protein